MSVAVLVVASHKLGVRGFTNIDDVQTTTAGLGPYCVQVARLFIDNNVVRGPEFCTTSFGINVCKSI